MKNLGSLLHRAKPGLAAPAAVASPAAAAGSGRYRPFDLPKDDVPGGPTHQPGVMPGHSYEALRTPFGSTGPPGAGLERNVTDLDLAANHHRDGFPFAELNGRGTHRAPIIPSQK